MELQGTLVGPFSILDVVSIALTGTELLLGIRLAQRVGRRMGDQAGVTSVLFLVAPMLSYALAAFVVVLSATWVGTAIVHASS
jgi:hypothetical protein